MNNGYEHLDSALPYSPFTVDAQQHERREKGANNLSISTLANHKTFMITFIFICKSPYVNLTYC